ncbi:MAG TPA: 16S rRNA (uracil(1498)-N(3))-methyltransferase [Pyrinomonadaceae bacterium]
MSLRRFYAPSDAFAPSGDGAAREVVLSSEESRHLRDVLRLRAGDEATVFDGEGREFACVVREPGGGRGSRGEARGGAAAVLDVRGPVEPPRPESPLALTLAVALLKGEKFDLVVQKATELGVRAVVPVITRRADVRLRDARDAGARLERWRRLALEAAKQSGRARVPAVAEPVEFSEFVATAASEDTRRLMFSERDGASLAEALGKADAASMAVTALVGPEGGWESEEIDAAREAGWRVVTLGGRVLRAETAAIAVAALLQHLCGDLR